MLEVCPGKFSPPGMPRSIPPTGKQARSFASVNLVSSDDPRGADEGTPWVFENLGPEEMYEMLRMIIGPAHEYLGLCRS
jgi:hypothetical protein